MSRSTRRTLLALAIAGLLAAVLAVAGAQGGRPRSLSLEDGPIFAGAAPPASGSEASLVLEAAYGSSHSLRWTSTDPVLGSVVTGFFSPVVWSASSSSPEVLVFQGSVGGIQLSGQVLQEPYNRAVVDLVRGSQRVRYLLQRACPDIPECGNGICDFCEGPQGPSACAEDCAQDPGNPQNSCGQIYDPSAGAWVHPDGLSPPAATQGPYGTQLSCCDDGYCTVEEETLGEECLDCRNQHCGNLRCEEETECGTGPNPSVLCQTDCTTLDCTPAVVPVCGNGACEGHWGWSEVCEVAASGNETACPEDCGGVWIPDPLDQAQTGFEDPQLQEQLGEEAAGGIGNGSWSCENGVHCGDGACAVAEHHLCDADCASIGYGACNSNGVCEPNPSGSPGQRDENGINCPQDCLPYGYGCGDGVCSLTEGLDFVDGLPEDFTPPIACSETALEADCGTGALAALAADPPSFRQLCGDPDDATVKGIAEKRCDAELCTKRYEYYYLDHTQYNVKHTWGNGEHQGFAVRSRDEWWDFRKLADGAGPKRCRTRHNDLQYIRNHGRTIHADHKEVRATHAIWTFEYDRQRVVTSASHRFAKSLFECSKVPSVYDGACDSICGNDGYAIPNKGLGQWDDDTPCTGFTPKFGRDAGGAGIFGTRCDTSTMAGWAAWGSRVVSPRFGHNSNNDANMTLKMFELCGVVAGKFNHFGAAPLWTPAQIAAWLGGSRGGAGGTDHTKDQQKLCEQLCDGNPENTGAAENFAEDGNDDPAPAERAGKPPCNTGGAAEESQANVATSKWATCDGCMNRNEATDATGNAQVQPVAACVNTGGCPACGFPGGKSVAGM